MLKSYALAALVAAALGLGAGSSSAAVTQIKFQHNGFFQPQTPFASDFNFTSTQLGLVQALDKTPYEVTLRYDSATPLANGAFAATLVGGGTAGNSNLFSGFSAEVRQSQFNAWDIMDFVVFANEGPRRREVIFTLIDTGGGLFANTGELAGLIDTSLLEQRNVNLRISSPGGFQSFISSNVQVTAEVAPPSGGQPGAVPEPATWAMMILGFGAAGSLFRRRRTALA